MNRTKRLFRNLICSVGITGALMLAPETINSQSDSSFQKQFTTQTTNSTSVKNIDRKVPESFGRLVEKHVDKIFKERYALTMEDKDFDHGHILIRSKGQESVQSLEELLFQTELILYHTDESCERWNRSTINPFEKKQRSIVGTKDGKVMTAIKYAKTTDSTFTYPYMIEIYHNYGTIFSWDLTGKDKTLKDGQRYDDAVFDPENPFNDQLYYTSFSFDLVPEKNGRFRYLNDQYDIYITLMPKKLFDSSVGSLAKIKVDTTSVIDQILNHYKTDYFLKPYEFPRYKKDK